MSEQMNLSNTVLEQLNWRYAVKKFDANRKIGASDWKVLEESLRLSPSSYGLQPWKFFIVQNPEVRKKLTPLSWNQTQVEDCSHLVVMATMPKMTEEHIQKFLNSIATTRGVPADSLEGYKKMMIGDVVKGPRAAIATHWAQRQAYIAMGFLMETAALLSIDTCPMEGIDPAGYDKVLGLEGTGYQTVAAVPCGYRSADDKYQTLKKVRFETSEVIKYI